MKLLVIYENVVKNGVYESLGQVVKRVSQSNAANAVLENDPQTRGGTFTRGGCANLAFALSEVLPGSEIWGIVRDNGRGIVDHVIVKPNKVHEIYLDADGCSTKDEMIARWSSVVKSPVILPVQRQNLGKIPFSEASVQEYRGIFDRIMRKSSIIREFFTKHNRLQL